MAWDAFHGRNPSCQTEEGLYGAGQDLLKDSFSGNVKGMGPGVAEMEFEERPNEACSQFLQQTKQNQVHSTIQSIQNVCRFTK